MTIWIRTRKTTITRGPGTKNDDALVGEGLGHPVLVAVQLPALEQLVALEQRLRRLEVVAVADHHPVEVLLGGPVLAQVADAQLPVALGRLGLARRRLDQLDVVQELGGNSCAKS